MQYRKIGKTEISVSEISLGCWTMGGLNWVDGKPSGWANVDESEITAAIKAAIARGVNHFDNADVYGNGAAERMLARVLKRLGVKSEKMVIASKVGHFRGAATHAYEAANIRKQCEKSLINLQRDYLDIYYLHHGSFGKDDRYLEEAAATMAELKKEGKVRAIGQSAYSSSQFARSVPIVKPSVLQSWAHCMDTKFVEETGIVGQLLKNREISFIAFSPLNQGVLLNKFDPKNPPRFEEGDHRKGSLKFRPAALEALRPKLKEMEGRFGSRTENLASVALRYVLSYPKVACVIPGFRNEAQVSCNLRASQSAFSEDDFDFVRTLFAK